MGESILLMLLVALGIILSPNTLRGIDEDDD